MRVVMSLGVALVVLAVTAASGAPRSLSASEQASIYGGSPYNDPGLCQTEQGGECSTANFDCETGDAYCAQSTHTGPCSYEVLYLNPVRCTSFGSPPPNPLRCYEVNPGVDDVVCSQARYCSCFNHPDLGWICSSGSDPWGNSYVGACRSEISDNGGI